MNTAGGGARDTGKRKPGFATRLLLAQALVLVAAALTSWLVAAVIGPGIFHNHLQRAGVKQTAAETAHVEQAFTSAMLLSLLMALLTALVMALGVTWYFTRRIQHSIAAVADSASDVAAGRYGARIARPGLGGEFDLLAASFNEMAERLDAVETARRRMLADLAHEMRTPLAALDAHLEALEDGVRELDASTLSVLRSGTQRLGRLAQDIGAVSQAQEGTLEIHASPVDSRELLHAATQAAQGSYSAKGVELVTDDAGSGTVLVDAERLGQVLGNLLDNALRHTPRGGTVTLVCRTTGGWVEFLVSDTGEGISAEHLAHIFDRFYRVDTARDRSHGGSGIGLTIARSLVEAHGGRISVESAGLGSGATFVVRLPTRVQ